jgi:hypothetical protein
VHRDADRPRLDGEIELKNEKTGKTITLKAGESRTISD